MQEKNKEFALSAETLRDLFEYQPATGDFIRRKRGGQTGKNVARWQAGQIAGHITNRGYRAIRIGDFAYSAHRLAVLYMTGEWPPHSVDHIDGDFANNRWANLRQCTHEENLQNMKKPVSNTSGFLGVYPKGKRWAAQITASGVLHHLGCFRTPEEAHFVYLDAKAKMHTFNPVPREAA